MGNHPSLYIIAGETSGDIHGARLMQSMKDSFVFKGIGGPRMIAEGLQTDFPFQDFQVMGFIDVAKSYFLLRKHFLRSAKQILEENPIAVLFIDYPGFNLRLARYLRKQGFKGKLIQFISPSVWAWKKNRIQSMIKTLTLLLTIYPFESDYFPKNSFPKKSFKVEYVGNPLIQHLKESPPDPLWRKTQGIPDKQPLLALFPGSRPAEIKQHLSLFLKTAERFKLKYPNFGILISVADPFIKKLIQNEIKNLTLQPIWLIEAEDRYSMMQNASIALAKSGTITLELALLGCPTVVAYQLSSINHFIARWILRLKLPYYSLPNILLNKPLFTEYYGKNLSSEDLKNGLVQQMESKEFVLQGQKDLQTLLTNKDAFEETGKAIKSCLLNEN